jgi:predicted nucleic acid-binding protein
MRVFIDANIWVYRLDQREPEKSRHIGEWLRKVAAEHHIVVSTQVLIELRQVLSRKLKPPLSHAEIRLTLNSLAAFEVAVSDVAAVLDAHELAENKQLSWFDALIVETAIRSRCELLFSEDLSHGRQIGGLTVRNPFLDQQDSFKTELGDAPP